jgi:hypothetical protein
MMRFIRLNPHRFKGGPWVPYFICLAKLSGGLLTEAVNVVQIIGNSSVADVIKDYIALEIISNIDNIMVTTVQEDVSGYLSENSMTISKSENIKSESVILEEVCQKYEDGGHPLNIWQKTLLAFFQALYSMLVFLFNVFYFYFSPFLVTFLVVLLADYGTDAPEVETLEKYKEALGVE